jgi:hypothetical protein
MRTIPLLATESLHTYLSKTNMMLPTKWQPWIRSLPRRPVSAMLVPALIAAAGCSAQPASHATDHGSAAPAIVAAAPTVPDTSLTFAEYDDLGVPALQKRWGPGDYSRTSKVIAELAKTERAKLPRSGSAKSGTLVAKIVSRDNVPPVGAPYRAYSLKSMAQSVSVIESHYIDHFQRGMGSTVAELETFKLYVLRLTMQALSAEVAANLGIAHKIAVENRGNVVESLASGFHLLAAMLGNRTDFSAADRSRIADAAAENAPELLSCLSAKDSASFLAKISEASATEPDAELKTKLATLSKMKAVEIQAGAAVVKPADEAVKAAGQDSPENALRAYVRVLRDGDEEGYKTLLCQNPQRVADGLKESPDESWPDDNYRVFSAEFQGTDQASIVEVYKAFIPRKPVYVRYWFKKVGGKWFLTNSDLLDPAAVDKARYPSEIAKGPDWADGGPKDLPPCKPKEVPKADFTTTDVAFAREFNADKDKASKKYADKWIEIEGTVSGDDVGAFSTPHELLLAGNADAVGPINLEDPVKTRTQRVTCLLSRAARRQGAELSLTQTVKLLGRFRVFPYGLTLFDCRIVSAGPDPTIKADAAHMAADLAADAVAAEMKYKRKELRIEGLVDEVEKKNQDAFGLYLKGVEKDGHSIRVKCFGFAYSQLDDVAKLTKGERVSVRGHYLRLFQDSIDIFPARLEAAPPTALGSQK